MIKIGVLGGNGKTRTIDLFCHFCKVAGLKVSAIKSLEKQVSFLHFPTDMSNYIYELTQNNTDVLIMKITYKELLNHSFSNIKFDMVICTTGRIDQEVQMVLPNERNLFQDLNKDDFIIMNVDDRRMFRLIRGSKANLITYGFNNRASVTASSVQEAENSCQRIQCCIQRELPTYTGEVLEPQEFPIKVEAISTSDLYSSLAAITAALINKVDICGCFTTSKSMISMV